MWEFPQTRGKKECGKCGGEKSAAQIPTGIVSSSSSLSLLQTACTHLFPRGEHTHARLKEEIWPREYSGSAIWFRLDRFRPPSAVKTSISSHSCIYTNPRPHEARVPIGARLMEPLPPQRHDWRIKTFPICNHTIKASTSNSSLIVAQMTCGHPNCSNMQRARRAARCGVIHEVTAQARRAPIPHRRPPGFR